MFKDKGSTKRKLVARIHPGSTTLDAKHQSMITQFGNKYDRLDSLKKDLDRLENEKAVLMEHIKELQSNEKFDDADKEWDNYIKLDDKSRDMRKEIVDIENCADELSYFEKTADILFDYYSILDDSNSDIKLKLPAKAAPSGRAASKKIAPAGKNILEAFMLNKETPTINESDEPDNVSTTNVSSVVQKTDDAPANLNKQQLVNSYMSTIDPTHVPTNDNPSNDDINMICSCCKRPYVVTYNDGIMYCDACGEQEFILIEQNKPVQRLQSKETSHFSYKRINHFNEWLSQIQGKESTEIPDDVFDSIIIEIKKEKITDPRKLTYDKMKEILKKLKSNKYYEHIAYIINKINGLPPPHFPPEIEEKLRSMFKEIQGPFLKHCPKHRKNFLSYSYVLFKFCELLELDAFLKHFPLLKSRDKLHQQDLIFKQICADLGWSFIPSV